MGRERQAAGNGKNCATWPALAMAPFVIILLAFCATGAPGREIDPELRKLPPEKLAQYAIEGTSIDGKKRDGAYVRGCDACAILCELHTPEADAQLKRMLLTFGLEPMLKNRILLSLGARGTKECVDIIAAFDTWAREISTSPSPFHLDLGEYGGNGRLCGERYTKKIGECVDPDGRRWAALVHPSYAESPTLWLTRHLKDQDWTWPELVALSLGEVNKDDALSGGPDTFTVATADEDLTFSLAETRKHSDGDGSAGLMEQFLGTDPACPDTDDDGVPDGKDMSPLTKPHEDLDPDDAAIRQAAFTTYVATNWGHMPIFNLDKGLRRPWAQTPGIPWIRRAHAPDGGAGSPTVQRE